MPTRNLKLLNCAVLCCAVLHTANTGRRCVPVEGRHRTAERASNARVRACVMDRNRRLLAIRRAQPPPQWWWLSIKARLSVCLVRGQPLDKLGGDGRPGAVGQKRSTDVGVPRHTPWASSKKHSATDWE